MRLRFTRRAIENLSEIAIYLHDRSPQASQGVRAAIDQSLQLLTAFPLAGRLQTTEGVRKLVTRRYFYLVYYTLDEASDEIVILNVKHPARRRKHADA